MRDITTDVIIIGGGPTGLALALELGRRGVATVLVDAGIAPLPGVRAGGISHQMMEQLRCFGLARRLREIAPIPPGWARSAVYATWLSEPAVAVLESGVPCDDLTAERPQNAPSAVVESMLREAVDEQPAVVTRYGWRFEGDLAQDADGVTAVIVAADGERARLRGRYLAACDGARSAVREAAGIRIFGSPGFATRWTLQFESPDLRESMGQGVHNQYWAINEQVVAYFLQRDATSRWTLHIQEATEEFQHAHYGDPAALVAAVVGAPVTVTAHEGLTRWRANAFWADRLREGSVFLVGDSGHAMPPGGLGLHLGSGDATNLAWKLAATLQGWADPALLDSYDAERHPFARLYALAVQTEAHPVRERIRDRLGSAGSARELDPGSVREWIVEANGSRIDRMLRTIYDTFGSSPVVSARVDGRDDDGLVVPGRRLPHRWLGPDDSVFDRMGDRPLLIAEDSARAAAARMSAAALAAGIRVDVLALPDATYDQPLVLVRPDRFVAWCSGSGVPAEDAVALSVGRRPRSEDAEPPAPLVSTVPLH